MQPARCLSTAYYVFAISLLLSINPSFASSQSGDAYQRGNLALQKHDLNAAIAAFTEMQQIDPLNASGYTGRGIALKLKGDYAKSISDYKEAVRLLSKNPEGPVRLVAADAYNVLAWMLATCPDASLRDGKKALEYAKASCDLTNSADPDKFDAVAAAYAEVGNFKEAASWQKKAVDSPDYNEDAAEAEQRLKLYQAGKPYREESPRK